MLLRPPYLTDENQHENDNISGLHSASDARKSSRSKGKPKKKQNSLSLRNKHHEERQKPEPTDRSYQRENDTGSVASHASGKSKKNKKKQSSLGGNKPRHMPMMNNSYSREESSPQPIDYNSNYNDKSEVKQLGLISSPQSKFEEKKKEPSKYEIQNFEEDEDDLPVVKLSQERATNKNGNKNFYEQKLSPKMAERKETRRLGKLFEQSRTRNMENTSQGASQLGGSFLNNSSAVGESRRSRSKLGQLFKEKSREKDSVYNNSRVDFTQNNSSIHFESSLQNEQLKQQSHIQPGPRGMNFKEALNQVENSKLTSTSRQKPKMNDNSMRPKILDDSVQQFHHDEKSDLNLSQSNQFNSRLKSRAQPSDSFNNKQSLCFNIQPERNPNKRKSGLRVTSKIPDQKEDMHKIDGNLMSKDFESNMVGINGNLTSKKLQSHQRLQNNLLENQKYLVESGLINNSPDDKKQEELKKKQEQVRRREQQMERDRKAIQERNARYEQQKAEEEQRRRESIERQRELYRQELEKRNQQNAERKIREQQQYQKRLENERIAKQRQAREQGERRRKQKQERQMRIREEERLQQQNIKREKEKQLQAEKQFERQRIRVREKERQIEMERQREREKQMQRERQLEKQRQAEKKRQIKQKYERERKMKEESQKVSTEAEIKFESLQKLPSSYSRVQSSVADGESERSVSSKKPNKKKKQSAIPMKKKTKVVVELSPRGEDSFYEDNKSNEEAITPSGPVFESKVGQGPKNILSFEDDDIYSGGQKIKSKTDTMFYDPSVSVKAPSSKPPLSRKSASSKSRPKQSSLTKKGDRKAQNVVIKRNNQKADASKNNQGGKKLSLVELAMQKQYEPRSQSESSYRSQQSFRSNDYSGSVQSRGSYNSRNSKKSGKKQSVVQIKAKQNSALLPNRPPTCRKLSPEGNLANRTISHQKQMEEVERNSSKRIKQESRTIVSKDVCFIDEKGRLVRKDIIIRGNRMESGGDSTFDENKVLNRMRQSREKRREKSRERSMERSRMSSTERSLDKNNKGSFSQTDSFLPHHRTDTNFVESEAYSQQDSGTEDYQGRLTGFSSAYEGFEQNKRSSNYYNESRNYIPSNQNSYHQKPSNSLNYLREFIKPVEEAGINQMQTPSRNNNNKLEQNTNQKRVLQRTERSAKKRY